MLQHEQLKFLKIQLSDFSLKSNVKVHIEILTNRQTTDTS